MLRLREWAPRSELSRALALALLLGLGLTPGCTTNHDALARQPKAGASAGGSGGSAGSSGFGNSGNSVSQGGRVNPDTETPGDDVLTIVHGVVDAQSIRLCFARLVDDGESFELVGSPSAELAYGSSLVVTELAGLSFADDAIQPWVLSGELELVDDLDCEEAVELAREEEGAVTPEAIAAAAAGGQGAGGAASEGAAGAEAEPAAGAAGQPGEGAAGAGGAQSEPEPLIPPRLRARPVAALPSGTLTIGRSILMVLSGCMGGAYYQDEIASAACGQDYSPQSPTLEPVVVKLSRAPSFSGVGLQGVHATVATTESVDLRSADSDGSVALTFASDIRFGAIEPRPADTRFSAAELGVTARDHGLQAVGDQGVLLQESWPDIRERSGLDSIEDSRNYAAILVGPNPLVVKKSWWNPSIFVLVESDPTRER